MTCDHFNPASWQWKMRRAYESDPLQEPRCVACDIGMSEHYRFRGLPSVALSVVACCEHAKFGFEVVLDKGAIQVDFCTGEDTLDAVRFCPWCGKRLEIRDATSGTTVQA